MTFQYLNKINGTVLFCRKSKNSLIQVQVTQGGELLNGLYH